MSGEIEVHRGLCTQLMLLILHANLWHSCHFTRPHLGFNLGCKLLKLRLLLKYGFQAPYAPHPATSTFANSIFNSQEVSSLCFIPSSFLSKIGTIALQTVRMVNVLTLKMHRSSYLRAQIHSAWPFQDADKSTWHCQPESNNTPLSLSCPHHLAYPLSPHLAKTPCIEVLCWRTLGLPTLVTSSHQTTMCTASLVKPYITEHTSHYTCFPLWYNLCSLLLFPISAQPSNRHTPSCSLFLPSHQSIHEYHLGLGLAHVVVPLNTHFLPPSKQYQSFPNYIAVQDCRQLQYFWFFLYIYSQSLIVMVRSPCLSVVRVLEFLDRGISQIGSQPDISIRKLS